MGNKGGKNKRKLRRRVKDGMRMKKEKIRKKE
jgi:hypothetical protein